MAKPLTDTGIRTFEIVQYISGPLEGELSDWPANIQDAVYEALELKSKQEDLPLAIVASRCDIDHDAETEGRPHQKFFLHIVASEIVMADERTIDPRRLI